MSESGKFSKISRRQTHSSIFPAPPTNLVLTQRLRLKSQQMRRLAQTLWYTLVYTQPVSECSSNQYQCLLSNQAVGGWRVGGGNMEMRDISFCNQKNWPSLISSRVLVARALVYNIESIKNISISIYAPGDPVLFIGISSLCKNQIVVKNLRIVAQ